MGKTARMKRERTRIPESIEKGRSGTTLSPPRFDRLTLLEDAVFCLFFFSLALAFTTSIQVHFTLPKLVSLRVCTLFILLLWIYRLSKGHIKALPKPVLFTGFALGLWWAFSSFFALHKYTALHGVYGRYNALLNHEIYLLLFFVIATMPMDTERIRRIAMIFVSALIPVTIYAFFQYHGFDFIPWPQGRPASTIGNPVILGAVLGLAVPFILMFFLQSLGKGVRHWSVYFWGATLLIFLYTVFTTFSRGPLLGAICSSAIVFVMSRNRRSINWKKVGIAFAIICILGSITFAANYKMASRLGESSGLYARLIYYRAALDGLKGHVLTGVGFENYRIIFPRFRPVEDNIYHKDTIPTMVHNGYLQTALTNGVPALVLYLAVLFLVLAWLTRTFRKSTDRNVRLLCAGFTGSIVGYMVQDLTGWLEIALTPFFWVVLGLGVALCLENTEKRPISGWGRNIGYCLGFLCAIGLLVLIYDATNRVYADRLFWKSQTMDATRGWPEIESNIADGLASVPGDFYYEDMAGLLYLKRFNMTGDPKAYRQGVEALEKAHSHNPFDVYVLLHRIDLEMVALRRGTIREAARSVETSVDDLLLADKNNPTVYEAAARLRLAEKRFDDALALIKKAEVLRPDPKYFLFEADVSHARSDVEGASAAYRKVVSQTEKQSPLPPEWASAKLGLTYMLITKHDLNGALNEVNTLIEGFPGMIEAYVARGDIYGGLGLFEKSKESFETALKMDPQNPYARMGLGQIEKLAPKTAGK